MSLPDDLLPGSFRGISFLMSTGNVTGTKKLIKKLFPNSTKQSIENLGAVPNTFQVTAVITGDDYLQRRNSLKLALDNDDPGTLIHPFYGTVENVYAASYEINEQMSNLADAKISIVFEVDNSESVPLAAGNSLSTLTRSNNDIVTESTASFVDQFNVSGAFPNNFSEAVNKVNSLIDAFNENTSFLSVSADQIDSFSLELSELSSKVTSIVTNPVALADSINSLLETANGLYSTPEITFTILKRFFNFGDNDIEIPENTASRLERIRNNAVLNQLVQTEALSYSYLNVSQLEFTNQQELEEISGELESQYQKIINNLSVNLQNPDIGVSPETKSLLTDLRVQIQQFFDQQQLTVQRTTTVSVFDVPSRVLAYQYYGSSNNGENLAILNDQADNPSFLSGQIEVLVP